MTSLRFKIIISMLLIWLLIIVGSYMLIQDIQTGIIEKEFREKGYLLANQTALELTDPVLVNDVMGIRNLIKDIKSSYTDIEYVYVTDSEGIVLAHTFENGFPQALKNMSKPSNIEKESVFDSEKGIIHEFDAPLFKNIGYVHVGVSESRVRAQIYETSQKLVLLAVSSMVLGGVFVYFTGRWLTKPVLKLIEGTKRINTGILDQKIEISSNDELGELASTFNDMALNLDQKIKDLLSSKEQTETAQKYLETLFNSIDDGIVVLNINHEIIKTNESFLRMMRLSEEQVLGRNCHELIQSSQYQREVCPIDTMLQTKQPVRVIHEVQINGDEKILEINGSLFLDSRGEANIIFVLRDATQQKVLEEEIITRNRELTILNEISKNISETFDLNKILIKALENLLKLTNMDAGDIYLPDEKSGDLILTVHAGKERNIILGETLEHIIRGNEVLVIEDIQKHPELKISTDQNTDIFFAGIPLKLKDKILGVITLWGKEPYKLSVKDKELLSAIGNQLGIAIENITFYNNIKYLKEFNEEILNNINLAIHVVDKDMRILAINDELLNLGRGRLKKEQIMNKNLFEVYPFLKEKHVDREYEHVIKTGELLQSEERTEYYGDVVYTSTSKIPIKDKDGSIEKIITVMKDVSEQRRLEEELKDSYDELRLTHLRLKELYKVKNSFLSNMSHELKTPLTSVIGYTELMLEEDINPDQRHKLEIVLRNSKRLSRLIKGLLDTTLIESRNLQLDIQTLSIYDLIIHVTEDMKTIASIKNIPIYIDIPQQLTVEGDRDRLIQVFSNILDNAIKFTIRGRVKITAKEENESVHIIIDDTGIGIPEDKLELIFDIFYQMDSTYSQPGTGLGLCISKNIVEAHKGKIWAESKNRGSMFHVLLPRRRGNE